MRAWPTAARRVLADAASASFGPGLGAAGRVRGGAPWDADRVIAEANNGGAMVDERPARRRRRPAAAAGPCVAGKGARAEPVAALFEARRCLFAGAFPELEDELTAMTADGAEGHSPDRADAMVWALTELVLRAPAEPRVRGS